jgi:catechol 2,3-dioxygenase-like lactoylglutathione lyase family enzyme
MNPGAPLRRRQIAATCATAILFTLGCRPGYTDQPGIEAIDHVGLATVDIDRSIHFYQDLFGMELVQRVEVNDQAEFNHIFALEHVKAKGAILRLGSMRIELFEFLSPRGRAPDLRQPVNNPRIYHICFVVKDINREYARLKAAGVPFHHEPEDFGIAKAAYGRDPDGNVFELLQWPAKDAAPH